MSKIAVALSIAALALAAGTAAVSAAEKDVPAAQAKISQQQATQTALSKVPGGVVKSAELERENGKLVWSFDVSTPGKSGVTEVWVDANTGNVVSLKAETAAEEAKEATKEAAGK